MDVSVLGRVGYDLYADQHGVTLKDVRSFSRHLGGSSANMAVGLSRLGLQVGIISCIGRDALGEYLLESLQKEGVNTDLVQLVDGLQSSLCLCEVSPPDSFPQVFYRHKAADEQLRVGSRELDFVAATRLFVTNGTSLSASPSRESTLGALERAHASAALVAFDVDYRAISWSSPEAARRQAREALPFVDVLIANPEELMLITGEECLDAALAAAAGIRVPMVAAKLGCEGTCLLVDGERLQLPPYPVEAVSTIGAGDGFAAGFLHAVVAHKPLDVALKYGNAAAAIVVSRLMCAEAMPTLAEVEEFMESHPNLEVETPGKERAAKHSKR